MKMSHFFSRKLRVFKGVTLILLICLIPVFAQTQAKAADLYYNQECDPGLIHHTSVFVDLDSAPLEPNALTQALLGDKNKPGLISRGQLADGQSLFVYFLKHEGGVEALDYVLRTCIVGKVARDVPKGLRVDAITSKKIERQDNRIQETIKVAATARKAHIRTKRPNKAMMIEVARLLRGEPNSQRMIKNLIYVGTLPDVSASDLKRIFPAGSLSMTEISFLSQNKMRGQIDADEELIWEKALSEAGGSLRTFNQPLSDPDVPLSAKNGVHLLKGYIGIFGQIGETSARTSIYLHKSASRDRASTDWLSFQDGGVLRSLPLRGSLACAQTSCKYQGEFAHIPETMKDYIQYKDIVALEYDTTWGKGSISRELDTQTPRIRYEMIVDVSGME